jgi:tetratricopeptide (TPR) repeat protein
VAVLLPVIGAVIVYAFTVCRTVYFGDSAELSAAAAGLGVAHPPGYPLYVLLGRLAAILLPGEPAFAINLLSAAAAAALAGAAAALAASLGARFSGALAAGLLVIGSRTVWSQATVAEVYTLNAAIAVAFLLALRDDERRPRRDLRALLLAAYLLGLGLAHHLSIVYVGLGGLILLVARRRFPVRALFPGVLLVAVALSLYAVLLVRSRLDPPLDWGNPETIERLIDHVTARPYHFLVGKLRGGDLLVRLGEIAVHLASDLHWIFTIPAVIGLAAFRRRLPWLAALVTVIAALTIHALNYGITDIAGHLLPAAVILAVAAGLGLDVLARIAGQALARRPLAHSSPAEGTTPMTSGRHLAVGRAIDWGIVLAAALPIALHWADADLSKHRSAREFGDNLLAGLPAGATLFAEGDNQVFLLAYLKSIVGVRPDVTVIDADGNLLEDFYRFRGEHGPPPAIGFRQYRLAFETAEIARWFAADPERPVFFTGRTNLPEAGPFLQATNGLVVQIRPRRSTAGEPIRLDAQDGSAIRTGAIRRDLVRGDGLTREVAARYWVRRGEGAFERGDSSAMAADFDSALAVAPDNADLASYLGAFYAQNRMLDRALPLLDRAVHLNPLSIRGWTNLGFALVMAGRRAEGEAALRESLRIQPDQEQVRTALRRIGGSMPSRKSTP